MVFTKKAALRQLLFVLFLFALLIPVAIWDSDAQVKVTFNDTAVNIKSDQLKMTIDYSLIESAELAPMGDRGTDIGEDVHDDGLVRTGLWSNADWGEYHICADLDTSVCVVVHLHDGRTFVFSRKNDTATEEDFNTLQLHLQ